MSMTEAETRRTSSDGMSDTATSAMVPEELPFLGFAGVHGS